MISLNVSLPRIVQRAMAFRAAEKIPSGQPSELARKLASVSSSPVSMASNRNVPTLVNQPKQQFAECFSHVSVSQPQLAEQRSQASGKSVKRQAPQPPQNMSQQESAVNQPRKRQAPQPPQTMSQQATQKESQTLVSQSRKRQAPQPPQQNKLASPQLNPADQKIFQAVQDMFQAGVASGQFKNTVGSAQHGLKMQKMNVDLSPIKLSSENFLRQGNELKLSPQGDSLAMKLRNALLERQQGMQKKDNVAVEGNASQAHKSHSAANTEKMVHELTLSENRQPADIAADALRGSVRSGEKTLSEMSELERGVYLKTRERVQRGSGEV